MRGGWGEAMILKGQVAVVTGASSGIGRAIALAFARAGAAVAVNYRRSEAAAAEVVDAARAAGADAVAVRADVGEPADAHRLVAAALARWGRIDVWVNNAGADILTGDAPRLPELDKLEMLWRTDVRGTFLCCRAVAPVMRRQGEGLILNMGWDHVEAGMAGPEAELYAAAKGAVWAFSRSLARSLAPHVRVNVLAPGWIETRFGQELDRDAYGRIARSTPLGRWGTPADVAEAAVFLASPGARFITGQAIVVNGGTVVR